MLVLAKNKLTALKQEALAQLLLEQEVGEYALSAFEQDHTTVTGSWEERFATITTAFRTWLRSQENQSYRWSYILAIRDTDLIIYTRDWDRDTQCYYSLPYALDGNTVTFDSNATQEVSATIVVTLLGMEEKEPEDVVVVEQTAEAVPVPTEETPVVPVVPVVPVAEAVTAQATEIIPNSLLQDNAYATDADGKTVALGRIVGSKVQDDDAKTLVIDCIVTRGNIINSRNQVYPTALWAGLIDSMNEQAAEGRFLGKVEHLNDQGLATVSLRWLPSFKLDGDNVLGQAVVIPTIPDGHNLRLLVEHEVQFDFSTVGVGSQSKGTFQDTDVNIINDDFVCVRIDAVRNGASFGSRLTGTSYQDASDNTEVNPTTNQSAAPSNEVAATTLTQSASPENKMDPIVVTTQTQTSEERTSALLATTNLTAARNAMIEQAKADLSDAGIASLTQALASATTSDALWQAHDAVIAPLKAAFAKPTPVAQTQSITAMPYSYVALSQEERAPQTEDELIDRMVQNIPDKKYEDPRGFAAQAEKQGGAPRHALMSSRGTVKMWLQNISREVGHGFHGPSAIRSLLALEQGRTELAQSLATGSTVAGGNADPGGAPLSAAYIFPLITRMYPKLIIPEIAGVQPMPTPTSKAFYLDFYRIVDGTDANDKRADINTTANPFSSSYANSAGEGQAVAQSRLRLSSVTLTAENKKIASQFSLEEMQDLRAYHGLDAQMELMGFQADEIAREWNLTVTNDMVAQATGSAQTYGTVIPASGGWVQKDWDSYISAYITKVSMDIAKTRYAPITHMVMGPEAAVAFGKSMRWTINSMDAEDPEQFAGTTFYTYTNPSGGKVKVIVNHLWSGANSYKILCLRRGPQWMDTPYVFAPYSDYAIPFWTNPTDFTQQGGIMSRAAYKVLVPGAMGVLTVSPGTTGVQLQNS